MALIYSISLTDWRQRRGYAGSGRGWRVHLFSLPDDNWNAMGTTIVESFHQNLGAANSQAERLARAYKIQFTPREE